MLVIHRSKLYANLYCLAAAVAAKLLQSCPTLCDPIDSSPPGSAVPGILQARTLEWVAISFSNAWKWKVKVKSLSRVQLFATPWTQPTRLLHPWDFPGKTTGVGCHCLLPMDMSLSKLQEFMMDREAWCAAIHGVSKSWTRLSDWTELNWTDPFEPWFSPDIHPRVGLLDPTGFYY